MHSNHGEVYTSTDGGVTWKKQGAAGSTNWTGITSSSDGLKLAAVSTGDCSGSWDCGEGSIMTSSDGGSTWTQRAASTAQYWTSVASSSDGTRLTAVSRGGNGNGSKVYYSTDSGSNWTDASPIAAVNEGFQWVSVASSGTGQYQAVADAGNTNQYNAVTFGSIYTSSNFGASWSKQSIAGNHSWASVAYSLDGTKLAAFDGGSIKQSETMSAGNIYISSDHGATWTVQSPAGNHYWYGIAISSDGTKLAAADGGTGKTGGYIYISTDGGVTWTANTGAGEHYWLSIASSADGMNITATNVEGLITTSTDGGASWSSRTISGSLVSKNLGIYNQGICILRSAAFESETTDDQKNGGVMCYFMLKYDNIWITDPSLLSNIKIEEPDSGSFTIRTNTLFSQLGSSSVFDGYNIWSKSGQFIQMKWFDYSRNTLSDGIYKISVTDTSGNTAEATMTFASGTGDPMTTEPIYPSNLSFDTSSKTLSWLNVPGASNYRVLVSEGTEDTSGLIYNSNWKSITGSPHIIPSTVTFTAGKTYYFYVDAHNSSDGNICNSNYMHRSAVYSVVY